MASTIPMLIIAGIAFVPLERELPADIDPNLDCGPVYQKVMPAFMETADVKMPCVLVLPDCGRHTNNRCKGGEWVR